MFRFLQKSSNSYVATINDLIGHLLGTAIVFVSFFAIVWLASFALNFLNSIYPFPARILKFIETSELYLIYGDSLVCALALLLTACNFILSMVGGKK